jgi:hypothetical protein
MQREGLADHGVAPFGVRLDIDPVDQIVELEFCTRPSLKSPSPPGRGLWITGRNVVIWSLGECSFAHVALPER